VRITTADEPFDSAEAQPHALTSVCFEKGI